MNEAKATEPCVIGYVSAATDRRREDDHAEGDVEDEDYEDDSITWSDGKNTVVQVRSFRGSRCFPPIVPCNLSLVQPRHNTGARTASPTDGPQRKGKSLPGNVKSKVYGRPLARSEADVLWLQIFHWTPCGHEVEVDLKT